MSKTGGLYIDSSAIFESFAEEVVKYIPKSPKSRLKNQAFDLWLKTSYFSIDFKVADQYGATPLHVAGLYGQIEVVKSNFYWVLEYDKRPYSPFCLLESREDPFQVGNSEEPLKALVV